jgi:hypothetical protein
VLFSASSVSSCQIRFVLLDFYRECDAHAGVTSNCQVERVLWVATAQPRLAAC